MLDQEQHLHTTVLISPRLVREVDTSGDPCRMTNATHRYTLWRIHNGRLQGEVYESFLYLHVAYNCAERNPYGTPISLPIHSPFHVFSSSQDDPMAIPDSPRRRAWSRSYDNHRAAPSLNVVRVKSESPELSMSIHEYPSSQPPQEHATVVSLTPNSSQISLSQAHQMPAKNAISQTLPDSENSLQARRPSPLTGSSITHPSWNRGYHILRSVAQQRPSQTDPIETDDSLLQEQMPRDRLAKDHLGPSLPVTAITLDRAQVLSPNNSTSDPRNVKSTELGNSSNMRNEQLLAPRIQSLGPSATHGAATSRPPLSTSALDLQGHLPTLTAPREDSPGQSVQVPLLESSDPRNSQDLYLDIGSTPINDMSASKAFATEHYPRDFQPKTTTDFSATEAASSVQTPPVRTSILDQTSHVDENPTPQLQTVEVPVYISQTSGDTELSRKNQLKSTPGPSAKSTTVADAGAQFGQELMASVDPSKKKGDDAKLKKAEQATREDQHISHIEVAPSKGGENTVQEENIAGCTTVSGGGTGQKQARPAVVDTPKKTSRATKEAVSVGGSDCKAPQESSVSKTEISGRKTTPSSEHVEGDRGTSRIEIGKVITKTDRSAEEKRKAEDKAKREADAVAQFLAKEEKKRGSKRKQSESNLVLQLSETPASVQGARQTSSTGIQYSSSPNVGNESLGKRSMTPLFPSTGPSLVRPTKSALRKSQSSTPRSVSFNDDPIVPLGPLETAASKWVEPKVESRKGASGTVKGSIATSKKAIAKPISSQVEVGQATPIKKGLKTSGAKLGPQAGKQNTSAVATGLPKPKTQTTLTVTRDVKLKGRADGPPKSPTPAMEKEEERASESGISASTFYSDEENLPRGAKAGPSKKRKLTYSMKSAASSLDIGSEEKQPPHTTVSKAEVHPSLPTARNVHGSHQNSTVRHPNISASNPKLQGKSSSPSISNQKSNAIAVAQVDSRQTSRSRSPAQYISKTSRASSGSASDAGLGAEPRSADESTSESGSQYETGSDSEGASASASDSVETDSLMDSNEGTSLSNGVEKEDSKSSRSQSETSRQPSNGKTLSVSSRSASQSRTDDEDTEKIARKLDQQLQQDARHSMRPPRQETTVPPAAKTGKPAPISSAKLGVSKFPSLTGLRGKVLKTDDNADASATQSPKTPLPSRITSKSGEQLQSQSDDDTSSSSSESEDETSSSDDPKSKANGHPSHESAQKTTGPQPRRIPGYRTIEKRMFSDGTPTTKTCLTVSSVSRRVRGIS